MRITQGLWLLYTNFQHTLALRTARHKKSLGYKRNSLAIYIPIHFTPSCNHNSNTWFHSLTFYRFQALLTLFSKFFSPFPHGTCLLSVSCQYLALDEIYHPFKIAFPNNPTLRYINIWNLNYKWFTGLSPSLIPLSKGFSSILIPRLHIQKLQFYHYWLILNLGSSRFTRRY